MQNEQLIRKTEAVAAALSVGRQTLTVPPTRSGKESPQAPHCTADSAAASVLFGEPKGPGGAARGGVRFLAGQWRRLSAQRPAKLNPTPKHLLKSMSMNESFTIEHRGCRL